MIVRLKGIKRVRSKGQDYYYHRRTMKRLPGKPGSAEFTSRLDELNSRGAIAAARSHSLGALILAYRRSPEFAALAPGSRAHYQGALNRLKGNEPVPIAAIDSAFLYGLRDIIAGEGSRSFTNRVVKVLRIMFSWGMKRGHCTSNPAASVDLLPRPRNAKEVNRPWAPGELDTVLQRAPLPLLPAIALAVYAGLRESDVAKATWTAYDGQYIRGRSQKTGEFVWMPAHYRLREILDAALRTSPNIVLNARGLPMTQHAVRAAFFRLIAVLAKEGAVAPGLSLHGLRHTLGSAIVELGGSNEEGAAVLGHASPKTTAHYTRHASRKVLATRAIERLEERDRNQKRKT